MWEIVIQLVVIVIGVLFAIAGYCMARSYPVPEDCTDIKAHIRSISKGWLILMTCFSVFAFTLLFVLYVAYIIEQGWGQDIISILLMGVTPFFLIWLPSYGFIVGLNHLAKAHTGGD